MLTETRHRDDQSIAVAAFTLLSTRVPVGTSGMFPLGTSTVTEAYGGLQRTTCRHRQRGADRIFPGQRPDDHGFKSLHHRQLAGQTPGDSQRAAGRLRVWSQVWSQLALRDLREHPGRAVVRVVLGTIGGSPKESTDRCRDVATDLKR